MVPPQKKVIWVVCVCGGVCVNVKRRLGFMCMMWLQWFVLVVMSFLLTLAVVYWVHVVDHKESLKSRKSSTQRRVYTVEETPHYYRVVYQCKAAGLSHHSTTEWPVDEWLLIEINWQCRLDLLPNPRTFYCPCWVLQQRVVSLVLVTLCTIHTVCVLCLV